MENILFICTGNTCRSFMAEEIFNDIIDKKNLKDRYIATSAGTGVYMDSPASENAIKALKDMGITVKEHISKQVTENMIKNADVVLTMSRSHKEFLEKRFPMYKDKFYTLSEYALGIQSIMAEEALTDDERKKIKILKSELTDLLSKRDELYNKLQEIQESIIKKSKEIDTLRSNSNIPKTGSDIVDPYGGSLDVYKKTAQIIKENINEIINYVACKEEGK